MYLPSQGNRILALDAETGKELWRHELPKETPTTARGVAFWPGDRNNPARILFTAGPKLVALNASTGDLSSGFGKGRQGRDHRCRGTACRRSTRTPSCWAPRRAKSSSGRPATRARSMRAPARSSGSFTPCRGREKRATRRGWTTDGRDAPASTTGAGTRRSTSSAASSTWRSAVRPPTTGAAIGRARTCLRIPSSPSMRRPANTSGTSRPCITTSGIPIMPSPPVLVDIRQNGRTIPALALVGKTGLMFILDRTNGKPIFGVEERPVPKGEVPGEWYSPTQPFPVKPPPLARMEFNKERDMVRAEDTSAEHVAACQELWDKSGGFYNAGAVHAVPVARRRRAAEEHDSVSGRHGRRELGRRRRRIRRTGFVFVNAHDTSLVGWIEKKKPGGNYGRGTEGATQPYDRASVNGPGPYAGFSAPMKDASGRTIANLPCQRPPWSRLIAVNANTGDIAWQTTARDQRGAAGREAERRRQRQRGADGDGGRPGVRRRDQRSPLPRVRLEDRQRAVEREAGEHGQREPDHVSGQERQAVRGGRRDRFRRRVRAALGCCWRIFVVLSFGGVLLLLLAVGGASPPHGGAAHPRTEPPPRHQGTRSGSGPHPPSSRFRCPWGGKFCPGFGRGGVWGWGGGGGEEEKVGRRGGGDGGGESGKRDGRQRRESDGPDKSDPAQRRGGWPADPHATTLE